MQTVTRVDQPMYWRQRTNGKPSLAGTVRQLLPMLFLLAAGREASCAPRTAQQFHHFAAPRPMQPGHTLVLGFMGGRDSWRNAEVGVGRTSQWLRQKAMPGVHVETVENLKRDLALRLVRVCLDSNGDGRLQPEERLRARIILYGQSFGGAAVVKFARQLGRLDIPVLLTVQIDSVGRGDGVIPPNVRTAANLYQDNGRLIRGEAPIRAADSGRTRILGNFRFDYSNLDIDLSHLRWYKKIGRRAHAKMDRDPAVWRKVEELIFNALQIDGFGENSSQKFPSRLSTFERIHDVDTELAKTGHTSGHDGQGVNDLSFPGSRSLVIYSRKPTIRRENLSVACLISAYASSKSFVISLGFRSWSSFLSVAI